jgi:hypothetical protein
MKESKLEENANIIKIKEVKKDKEKEKEAQQ